MTVPGTYVIERVRGALKPARLARRCDDGAVPIDPATPAPHACR